MQVNRQMQYLISLKKNPNCKNTDIVINTHGHNIYTSFPKYLQLTYILNVILPIKTEKYECPPYFHDLEMNNK